MKMIFRMPVLQSVAIGAMCFLALGYRFALIPFTVSFLAYLVFGLFLVVTALILLVSMIKHPSLAKAALIIIGLLPLIVFLVLVGSGGLNAPRIHDVSTRQDPPIVFEVAQTRRSSSENSLVPAPEETLSLQRQYYPDIKSRVINSTVDECFAKVDLAVNQLNWVVIGKNAQAFWLEAYETTFLFGFKDDVRIELASTAEDRCRVDMRSVSRVGVSDLGANAKRIRRFFDTLARVSGGEH